MVTACTHQREMLFGQIREGMMVPNRLGEIVQRAWFDLPSHYPHVTLGAFCLMPNHMHGIIILTNEPRRGGSSYETDENIMPTDLIRGGDHVPEQTRPYAPADGMMPPTDLIRGGDHALEQTRPYGPSDETMVRHGLPEIVRAFKSFSARRINAIRRSPGESVWQRNYYEHVIRDNADWERIHNYIQANPRLWEKDQLNPNLES